MQYLKVCQNVNFLFNLSNKTTLYNMLFLKYRIVANSAILKPLWHHKKPVLHKSMVRDRYFHAFQIPLAFSILKTWSKFPCFELLQWTFFNTNTLKCWHKMLPIMPDKKNPVLHKVSSLHQSRFPQKNSVGILKIFQATKH